MESQLSLEELGRNYRTDKVDHGFLPFYERCFKNIRYDVKNVLEIGVLFGASIRMWADYFPNATIQGIENEQDEKIPNFNNPRIIINKIDQRKKDQLEVFRNSVNTEFDIIIDDGSHFHAHQQLTLEMLFPLVKSGGFYGIEDLHSKNADVYGFTSNHPFTTYAVLKTLKNNKQINSNLISEEAKQYIIENIAEMEVFESDKLSHLGNAITSMIKKK
jgi:cephalosporin hydroxylase